MRFGKRKIITDIDGGTHLECRLNAEMIMYKFAGCCNV